MQYSSIKKQINVYEIMDTVDLAVYNASSTKYILGIKAALTIKKNTISPKTPQLRYKKKTSSKPPNEP